MDMETVKNIGAILGVITGAVAVLELVFSPIRRYLKWCKYLRDTFAAVWKPPRCLKPEIVMGSRGTAKGGFRRYYHHRDADRAIRERIAKGQHVLILGDPLAGKTRAAYEALKATKRLAVTIPCLDDIKREAFRSARGEGERGGEVGSPSRRERVRVRGKVPWAARG